MADRPPIARTVADLRQQIGDWRMAGLSVGLVPTMGALHDGHVALVEAARRGCDRVVVSIFVNPAQFNDPGDLAAYPRNEAGDLALLAAVGTDLAYLPGVAEIYPDGFQTKVTVSEVTRGLCGDHRPGHFDGVATVVCKLLLQCVPDVAYFGEKDYQQLVTVRRLVRDLDIPVAISGVPTVRAEDGLALSSRNVLLGDADRAAAMALNRVLADIAESLADKDEPAAAHLESGSQALLAAGFDRVEYLELRDAETLEALPSASRPARILGAAWIGGVRLIDNRAVR